MARHRMRCGRTSRTVPTSIWCTVFLRNRASPGTTSARSIMVGALLQPLRATISSLHSFIPRRALTRDWRSTETFCPGTPNCLFPQTTMLLIPAIDLKDGHCVRLKQGDMDQSTVFGEDPAAMARSWVDKGARRVHLVDLNGAFAGKPKNEQAIRAILKEVGSEVDVQLGGGIRDLDTIERYLDAGLRYVIIGTAAVKNPGFLQDACTAFGGHIIVGLDAKDGKVATDGWSKLTGHEVVDLGKKFEDYGVEGII